MNELLFPVEELEDLTPAVFRPKFNGVKERNSQARRRLAIASASTDL